MPRARGGAALWSCAGCSHFSLGPAQPSAWITALLFLEASPHWVQLPLVCFLQAELRVWLLLPSLSTSATCLCLDKPRNEALRAGACQVGTCHPQGQLGTSCNGEVHSERVKQVHEPLVASNPLQWNQDAAKLHKDLSILSPKCGQRAWKILDFFGAGESPHKNWVYRSLDSFA